MTYSPKNFLAQDYILIDIETNSNGLQASHQDEIIDLAAIRINADSSFSEFSTRIKIKGKLKPFAKFLTGIKEKELDLGLEIELAISQLEQFMGDLPIIGHNIKRFDIPVLKNYSEIIHKREVYDTIELALLIDTANKEGHSVQKYLQAIKGKSYQEKHQALSDCWDEQSLLEYLLTDKLEQNWGNKLPQLKKISEYLINDDIKWATVIQNILNERLIPNDDELLNLLPSIYLPLVVKKKSNENDKNKSSQPISHISQEEINNIFAGKILGKSFVGNFEERPQQLKLAQVIAEGISTGKHVIAEAETGVGKTLAYLIPAVLHAIKSKQKVVIATKTKLLQDQIMYDDLPKVAKLFPANSFKSLSLKGRENYACLLKSADYLENYQFNKSKDKFSAFKYQDSESFSELFSKILIANWLILTPDGDLEKFPFYISKHAPNGLSIKANIKSIKGQCINQFCPYFQHCFIRKNREEAKQVDLVITNYNLILSDLLGIIDNAYITKHDINNAEPKNPFDDEDVINSAIGTLEGGILPEFDALIFDEAHNLESVATESLTFKFSQQILKNIWLELTTFEVVGSVPKRLRALGKNIPIQNLIDLLQQNDNLSVNIYTIWSSLIKSPIIKNKIKRELSYSGDQGYDVVIQLQFSDIKNDHWENIRSKCEHFNSILKKLKKEIKDMTNEAIEIDFITEENYKTFKTTVSYIFELIDFIYNCLHYLAFLNIDHQEILVEARALRNNDNLKDIFDSIFDMEFALIPIDIADLLYQKLWQNLHHATLISATLSSNHQNFNLTANITGFSKSSRYQSVVETSPFNYADNALLIHLVDLPNCKNADYKTLAINFLQKILLINKGRALILCTTKKDVEYIYNNISDICDGNGIYVLAQSSNDVDAVSNKRLVEGMRENKQMVLIGTNSLHEGIDIPGENLDLVIIWKLPFLVPSPFIKAKREKYDDYYIEKSVARFRQQCGRLIRTKSDRGHILVLDKRFPNSEFVPSLPKDMLKLPFYSASIEKLLTNWEKKRHNIKFTPRQNLYEVFPVAKERFEK